MNKLFVLLLAPLSALAQTAAIGSTDPARGVTLAPTAASLTDEATALTLNPAGLTHVGRANVVYVHERSNTRSLDSDAVFAAAAAGGVVGVGFAGQSLRPNGGAPRGKVSLGGSAGGQLLSAGVAVNWLSGGALGSVTTVDVGLLSRPWRWLAVGAVLRSLNAPEKNGIAVSREYSLSVGARPFGERLSLGVDWLAPEAQPLGSSRLQYTALARILPGLSLGAGFSHGLGPLEPWTVQGGLTLDLENFGYTQGVAYSGGRLDWQFQARLSADKYPALIRPPKIALLSTADLGSAGGGTLGALLGITAEDRHLRLLRTLERAAEDPELAGVVLKVEGSGLGLARADELRAGLERLRAKGKKIYAYALSMTDAEYLVTSACDGIYAPPDAMLMVDGLRSTLQYFGGTAELLGIGVDVARVGAYKTFPDQFTRKDMSDEQRETIDAYLDTMEQTLEARVTAGRKLTHDEWRTIVDEGLKPVKRAKALKQIDDVWIPAQLDEAVQTLLPGARITKGYAPGDTRDVRWGTPPQIAVVPVLGSITGGQNQNSPLGQGQIAGAQSFIEAISAAAEEPSVKAIVVRVDSGGGDALASDLMYRAVLEAKKKKPVVASMGDVAASGGYYAAMGADVIYALPTTITGSIGIFFAKPAVKKLAEALGVAQVSINRGKVAGVMDFIEPWTEAQRQAVQAWVDAGYDNFITEVAASRKLPKAQVDAVARGRVWSGADAQKRGLVDQLGGLMDAVAEARRRAGVGSDVDVAVWASRGSALGSLLGAVAPAVLASPAPAAPVVPPAFEALLRSLGPAGWLFEAPGLQARMEYTLTIQ